MENHIEVRKKQDKGFTLVELLIVIVILGILATVTVFAVRGITDQGKPSTCKADQKTLQTACRGVHRPIRRNNPVVPLTEANPVPAFLHSVSPELRSSCGRHAPAYAVLPAHRLANTNGCTAMI